jgi:hypothetical protein
LNLVPSLFLVLILSLLSTSCARYDDNDKNQLAELENTIENLQNELAEQSKKNSQTDDPGSDDKGNDNGKKTATPSRDLVEITGSAYHDYKQGLSDWKLIGADLSLFRYKNQAQMLAVFLGTDSVLYKRHLYTPGILEYAAQIEYPAEVWLKTEKDINQDYSSEENGGFFLEAFDYLPTDLNLALVAGVNADQSEATQEYLVYQSIDTGDQEGSNEQNQYLKGLPRFHFYLENEAHFKSFIQMKNAGLVNTEAGLESIGHERTKEVLAFLNGNKVKYSESLASSMGGKGSFSEKRAVYYSESIGKITVIELKHGKRTGGTYKERALRTVIQISQSMPNETLPASEFDQSEYILLGPDGEPVVYIAASKELDISDPDNNEAELASKVRYFYATGSGQLIGQKWSHIQTDLMKAARVSGQDDDPVVDESL